MKAGDPVLVIEAMKMENEIQAPVSGTVIGVFVAKGDAVTPDDAMLVGDFTQVAYANVNATSNVYDVSLNNYTNLGSLDRPIVSSVATAVGNNLAITVTSPGP